MLPRADARGYYQTSLGDFKPREVTSPHIHGLALRADPTIFIVRGKPRTYLLTSITFYAFAALARQWSKIRI